MLLPCIRQIWDTAGQEKYHSLAPMYYRGAGAAIVVYDITKMHSFRTLKEWVNELQAQGPQDIAIAIAGNKRDLESERVSPTILSPRRCRENLLSPPGSVSSCVWSSLE